MRHARHRAHWRCGAPDHYAACRLVGRQSGERKAANRQVKCHPPAEAGMTVMPTPEATMWRMVSSELPRSHAVIRPACLLPSHKGRALVTKAVAGAEHQQRLCIQFRRIDRLARHPRMIGGHKDGEIRRTQPASAGRPVYRQRQMVVEFAGFQAGQQCMGKRFFQQQRHCWRPLLQQGERVAATATARWSG